MCLDQLMTRLVYLDLEKPNCNYKYIYVLATDGGFQIFYAFEIVFMTHCIKHDYLVDRMGGVLE